MATCVVGVVGGVVLAISAVRDNIAVGVIKHTVLWVLLVLGKHVTPFRGSVSGWKKVLHGKRLGLGNDPRRPSVGLNSRGNLYPGGDT